MKKILSGILGLFALCTAAISQDIFITLEYKSGPDSFYVSMTPTFSDPTFNMGSSQITLVFNSTFPVSSPFNGSVAITSLTGAAFSAQDFAQEPGGAQKKFGSFFTSGAALGNINAGQKVTLFRFRVNGGNCVGGTTLRNFVNGVDPSDPAGTFQDFSTFIAEVPSGEHFSNNSNVSLLACTQLILPAKVIEFNARRNGNDGIVSWTAAGEDPNSDYYEVERSTDGSLFQSIGSIDCRKLPGLQKYEYTDRNITNLNSKYIYYRLRQYDLDGKFVLSGIRQLKMDISGIGVQIYPNPVISGFYINVPFTNPDQSKVSLIILSGSGQAVDSREITMQQATNYYYDIRKSLFASGDYYLKIVHSGQVVEVKKFFINKD